MAQTKADRLLNRIQTLHRNLREDDEQPSALERDLMLGYLRDLYAIYLNGEGEQKKKQTPPPPKAAPEPAPEPPAPPRPSSPPPVTPAPAPAAPPPVVEAPLPPPPAPSLTSNVAHVQQTEVLPPELEELFQEKKSNHLSSRVIRQRVPDLTRALSINNRVQFANKLFDGTDELNQRLKELNLKGSMENARPLLIELARRHEWHRPQRQEVAREFIALVRRRYA